MSPSLPRCRPRGLQSLFRPPRDEALGAIPTVGHAGSREASMNDTQKVIKSDEEWRKVLTPEQFRILREHGTERAFGGSYWNHHEVGLYVCAACRHPLF